MHHFIRILLPAVFLVSLGVAFASTTLTDEKVISGIGKNVDILEDSTGTLNIHQVTAPEYSARFLPSRAAAPNLGYTRSAIWVRFKLKNLTFSDPWVLQAAFPDMDNVELYSGEGSNWEVRELGQVLPFSSRKIINRDLLFQLSLPFGKETTFYLRYQNETGMTLPLRLFSFEQYQTYALAEHLLFGIFFGFMLVLSLYNLILFFKVRESGYLHYFLYVTGYGLFQFSLYGLAHQYLWPGRTWWANHNLPFFLAFAFFCRILFTMSVLDCKGNAPRLHRALKVLLAAPVLFAAHQGLAVLDLLPPALVLETRTALGLSALYFSAFTVVIFMLNIRCLGKKTPAARSFMGAWIFMVCGLLLYALKVLGYLPSNFITEYGMLFGSVGEMCLLFISLGESIQAIKLEAQEKHRRQQAAILAFQEEQIHAMRLELELLKANIHPHFMLNSINAAIMWIKEDPGAAEKLLHALSIELKLLLKVVGEKVIPIDEEIRICRMHLEVMSLRHDKSFTLRLEGIKAGERIPPMVFHTLVENGLTHGYAGKEAGVFVLTRTEDEGKIRFTLFNDGMAGNKTPGSNGLGLKYVRARLEEAYGRKWRLDSHSIDGGWLVTIAIQKEGSRLSPEAGEAHQALLAGSGQRHNP
jgi:7TM protein involved in diverse intracellular signaling/7TMR-DISM extracellular protein 2/histidine kinase